VFLLLDNARLHTSHPTTLASFGFTVVPQPSYSLDLAMSDYALLDKMKEPLYGRQFPNNNNFQSSVCKSVHAAWKDWCAAAIMKLPER
jgi:hypothetical protein